MPRKFKIGETVGYTPPRGSTRVEPGTFTIIHFFPANDRKPMYRIRHDDSKAELLARESELYKFSRRSI
jgi:hypothetical protein